MIIKFPVRIRISQGINPITRKSISRFRFDWDNSNEKRPEDLLVAVVSYVYSIGRSVNCDKNNMVVVFQKESDLDSEELICLVLVRFSRKKKDTQFFLFRKIKTEVNEWDKWRVVKVSETMTYPYIKDEWNLSLRWKDP